MQTIDHFFHNNTVITYVSVISIPVKRSRVRVTRTRKTYGTWIFFPTVARDVCRYTNRRRPVSSGRREIRTSDRSWPKTTPLPEGGVFVRHSAVKRRIPSSSSRRLRVCDRGFTTETELVRTPVDRGSAFLLNNPRAGVRRVRKITSK